jgi:hypothetical protein
MNLSTKLPARDYPSRQRRLFPNDKPVQGKEAFNSANVGNQSRDVGKSFRRYRVQDAEPWLLAVPVASALGVPGDQLREQRFKFSER